MAGRKRRGVWKGATQPFVAAGVRSSRVAAEDTGAAATADTDGTEIGRWGFLYMPLSSGCWGCNRFLQKFPSEVSFRNFPQDALGLVTMMLHQVTVMNAALLGHTRMLRTDCFGETRLVLHVPGSS